ncbi:MAG: hypothetical protein HZT43_10025 [Exiguobacterium profundum]|nr:MAG: hypothetical protein HZT43_10025 [Exiguobacterium profundum]
MVPDRPVLLALDLVPVPGAWTGYTVVPLRFVSLGAAQLAMLAPAVVAMPLWARGADAVQMLQRLAELGYSGPVEVHGPRLPDQRMVMAELTQVAEGLQVRLVERPSQPRLGLRRGHRWPRADLGPCPGERLIRDCHAPCPRPAACPLRCRSR